LALPVEKGYRILDIYEVYEYQVTQYSPEISDGGIFVDNTNTFLKLKAEASGYPSRVRSPSDKERYVEWFWKKEGISITLKNWFWPNSASTLCGKN